MFEMEKSVAEQSETIKKLIKEMETDGAIPLDNVTGLILSRVIKYCRMHTSATVEAGKLGISSLCLSFLLFWQNLLCLLQLMSCLLFEGCGYLNIKELLDLTCHKATHMISKKTMEENRKIFNIKNDFTPEEEANIRIENRWAYQ
ncbi:SKP1-like protein 3 [Linum grandiflorum]